MVCVGQFLHSIRSVLQKNLAKRKARQRCMFEGPVRTRSKLTDPSTMIMKASIYIVLFTLARDRDQSCAAILAQNRKFSLPPVI